MDRASDQLLDDDVAGAIVLSEAGAIAADEAGAIAGADEAGAIVVSEAGAIGAADDVTTAALDDAATTAGVAGGRLKIQIRPMITITATMMMIQVLRFMQETLGCWNVDREVC